METCMQFDGMNVLQHGYDVSLRYKHLVNELVYNREDEAGKKYWRLPEWIYNERLIKAQLDPKLVELYQLYHDCGKPYCLQIDENGQRHFPNHAEISKRVWDKHSDGSESDRLVGELIGMDMLAHTVRGEELIRFSKHFAGPTLLFTALAEVHSNATYLNRMNSDGFKIKCKQLDKVAKAILTFGLEPAII